MLGKGQVSVNKNAAKVAACQNNTSSTGEYTVTVNGKKYSVKLDSDAKATVNGKTYDIAVKDGIDSAPAASTGAGEAVNASLPGNVLRVETSVGASVAEGDVLLVLEAMKMEIEVKAPKAGTVQSILVAQGDKVVNGTPLVTIG